MHEYMYIHEHMFPVNAFKSLSVNCTWFSFVPNSMAKTFIQGSFMYGYICVLTCEGVRGGGVGHRGGEFIHVWVHMCAHM